VSEVLAALVREHVLQEYAFNDDNFLIAEFQRNDAPKKISSLVGAAGNAASVSLKDLSFALAELRNGEPKSIWRDAIYLPSLRLCVASSMSDPTESEADRYALAVALLVGAIPDTSLDIETIKKLNPNLETSEIREFLKTLGFEDSHLLSKFGRSTIPDPETFNLPGRPELQNFFREHIIDFFFRFEEYRAMGFSAPNGILLFGPPGSGKTFAVNKLAEFLKWSVFDVDVSEIGSPYIHETSRKLKQVFETASEQAPSIILLEEIDALAARRSDTTHDSKVEEVSQLLRLLEKAASNGILVVATTNRYEALDSAIVRRGRFDHVIEVGYPSAVEICLALESLLKQKPSSAAIQIDRIAAKLIGRPMSDVSWVVNEAARFAVRSSQKEINEELLMKAIESLGKGAPRI
jgi:adenylate kinase family enzyme